MQVIKLAEHSSSGGVGSSREKDWRQLNSYRIDRNCQEFCQFRGVKDVGMQMVRIR
jgi:hypothetical protein